VRVDKDHEVPADLLVLSTSNFTGLVFVDTMNLDGETNLKEKTALLESLEHEEMAELQGEALIDAPNDLLEFWECMLRCDMITSERVKHCTINNLLLRGSYIRNT